MIFERSIMPCVLAYSMQRLVQKHCHISYQQGMRLFQVLLWFLFSEKPLVSQDLDMGQLCRYKERPSSKTSHKVKLNGKYDMVILPSWHTKRTHLSWQDHVVRWAFLISVPHYFNTREKNRAVGHIKQKICKQYLLEATEISWWIQRWEDETQG